MITLGRAAFQTQLRFDEYYGLSTDKKPTKMMNNVDIPNGGANISGATNIITFN